MAVGTVSTIWGDALCSLDLYAQSVDSGRIILFGREGSLEDFRVFLEAQDFIRDVIPVALSDMEFHHHVWRSRDQYGLLHHLAERGGVPRDELVSTHMHHEHWFSEPWPTPPLRMDDEASEWAAATARDLGDFVLAQPFSFHSTDYDSHWPVWFEALSWLCERENVVLAGEDWSPVPWGQLAGSLPCRSLVGCFPSMRHLLALSNHASCVVTTSNALSIWCAKQGTTSVVACNARVHQRRMFYESMTGPKNALILYNSTLAEFCEAFDERTGR